MNDRVFPERASAEFGPEARDSTWPVAVPASPPPLMSALSATSIGHVLGDLRRRLAMDVALVSHFEDGRRVIDIIDATETLPFGPGDSDPIDQTYCQPIVDGRLPEIIPDTSRNAMAMSIAATRAIDIAAPANVGGVEVGALDHAHRARSLSDLANASLCAPWRQHHAPTHRSMQP